MIPFKIKRMQLKYCDNLQLLLKKFIVRNLSAPCKRKILELKENYAHEHSQAYVNVM